MNARTCIGCRRPDDADRLIRLVWSEARGAVVVDGRRRLPGRGAWIHDDDVCRERADKRRTLARALRRPLPDGALSAACSAPGRAEN